MQLRDAGFACAWRGQWGNPFTALTGRAGVALVVSSALSSILFGTVLFGGLACSVKKGEPDWKAVVGSWGSVRSAAYQVRLRRQADGHSVDLYRYTLEFRANSLHIELESGLDLRMVAHFSEGVLQEEDVAPKSFSEIFYESGPADVNLAELLALVNDPLNPFGLIAGPPSNRAVTPMGYQFEWQLSERDWKRTIRVTVDRRTLLPTECRIRGASGAEVIATYDFGAIVGNWQVSSSALQRLQPAEDWREAARRSLLLGKMRELSSNQVPDPESAPRDSFSGYLDEWRASTDVRRLSSLVEARRLAERFPALPVAWPVPTDVWFRNISDLPAFRLEYSSQGVRWRVQISFGEKATVAFKYHLQGADRTVEQLGRAVAWSDGYASQGIGGSSSWIETKVGALIEVDAMPGDSETLQLRTIELLLQLALLPTN